ncbi:unnamed protein product [Eruca vesicaria subsp. sativa]|uniref:Uncharacterized protein n=1 Tax=Eruca vesicaria subsp. sativa TaxID=29727 RepID=A0ABC8LSK1_ERUVS|nr:unnamed protein product [Eruca vesicaria subsp. sativa]
MKPLLMAMDSVNRRLSQAGKQMVRNQSEEQNHPNKSPRSSDKPSPSNKKEGDGFKKPKSRKEAWSVMKPPKQPQTNKGSN